MGCWELLSTTFLCCIWGRELWHFCSDISKNSWKLRILMVPILNVKSHKNLAAQDSIKVCSSPASKRREKSLVDIEEELKAEAGESQSEITMRSDNSKASGDDKSDYIHVRARRGQATDSHSLAERARREKISKKMKYLQDLVPGCNKVTGKAGMLDEIITMCNLFKSKWEFLSLKLSTVPPRLDFNVDNLFSKEVIKLLFFQ
ncbi:hypothetical protein Leryth_023283 [Lithospermum erythrorhizon]|nr:hypothetical protein Leryth_023283 [Lithospermum erythrorhizon]